MKKLISVFLILCMIPCICFASSPTKASEIDLSGLSFVELSSLRDRILKEMWESYEWQEVTVQQGIYTVGVEIPAGEWDITCYDNGDRASNNILTMISYGFDKDGDGKPNTSSGGYASVYKKNHLYFEKGSLTVYKVSLQEGMLVEIDELFLPAVFTPSTGAQTFSFK